MGARVDKSIITGEIALVCKRIGKPSWIFSGYQYRIHGNNSELISWEILKTNEVSAKGS